MNTEQKAERARALLKDDLLQEAFTNIRERQKNAFASSAPDEQGVREQAYAMLQAIKKLEGELNNFIANHQREVRKRGND